MRARGGLACKWEVKKKWQLSKRNKNARAVPGSDRIILKTRGGGELGCKGERQSHAIGATGGEGDGAGMVGMMEKVEQCRAKPIAGRGERKYAAGLCIVCCSRARVEVTLGRRAGGGANIQRTEGRGESCAALGGDSNLRRSSVSRGAFFAFEGKTTWRQFVGHTIT